MSIGVRIQVPSDLYNLLCDEQEKRKAATGKTIPLADIVYEFFKVGLQSDLAGLKPETLGNAQNSAQAEAILQVQKKALEQTHRDKQLEEKELRLDSLEFNLKNKENDLRRRERELYKGHDEINDKYKQFYEKMNKLSNEREKSLEKVVDNGFNKKELQNLKEESIKKDEEIKHLKEQVINSLEIIEDKLDDKPDSNIWRDWVIPSLGPVLIGIISFIASKKFKSMDDLDPIINKVKDLFNESDPAKVKNIFDSLKDVFNNNKREKNPRA